MRKNDIKIFNLPIVVVINKEMNTFLATHILSYAIQSRHKRGHGIHSPFVYNLIRTVFIDYDKYSDYAVIEKVRTQLLNNTKELKIVDFGAGSYTLQHNVRKVSKIAASSLSPRKYAQLLYRIVKSFKPQNILEMGTSLGISASYMALANPNARCISLEGDPSIADIAKQTITQCGVNNVEVRVGNFEQTLIPTLQDLGQVNFAFIDGNHQKEATINYFETILPFCNEHTILVFDDIYWSKGMMEAWQYIIAHSSVSISIDICKLGFVFFRKGIMKQNFRIRY